MSDLANDTWIDDPDWVGCANGCACAPDRGRDLCWICVVKEARCKRIEARGLAKAEQLQLFEVGT